MFQSIQTVLTGVAEHYLSLLSSDLMTISAMTRELTLEDPLIQKVLSQLDLISSWVRIHESILEKYESKKFFGY